MRPPLNDLTDNVFGELTVLDLKGRARDSKNTPLWLCRCSCGRREVIKQKFLTRTSRPVTKCSDCQRPRCQVCNEKIPASYASITVCSDHCRAIRDRQRWRDEYHERIAKDPELNSRQWQRRKEMADNDPDAAARLREYNARSSRRRAERRETDPDYAAHLNAQSRESYYRNRDAKLGARCARRRHDHEYAKRIRDQNRLSYQRHADKILASRKSRWSALSPEQQAQELDDQRARNRLWRRRWRTELSKDPKRKREQLAREREWERNRELRRLFANLEKLRKNDDE